ncbi:DUF4296 domain-containing protein [Hymenobacter rigui]|uniref:DUF4296 domain-containing protein n=1 Tax=Hymenobacter rigui TaxID=334424 RepID=A0A3R9V8G4_9BACT|nr:DUF4296 domain-containing protein [Hymenobacter rigui]
MRISIWRSLRTSCWKGESAGFISTKLRLPPNFATVKRYSFRAGSWLCALALLVTACQKPEEVPVPAQLIPRDKMVSLLVELHLLEARTDAAILPQDSARALFRQQQKDVYWRYEVTDSAFVQSYRYYAIHDKDLDEIYSTVVDSLSLREARLTTPGSPPPHP